MTKTVFRWLGAGLVGGATLVGIAFHVFALPQAELRARTLQKRLQEQLKQLHVTLLNLKVVTTYVKELAETLAQKTNRVIFSGKPATLTPESEIIKSSKPLPARRP